MTSSLLKNHIPSILASVLAFTLVPVSNGQVVTVPVGFVKFIPEPSPDGTARKYTVGSFPLQGAAKWAGTVNLEPVGNAIVGTNAAWAGYGPAADGFVTHVIRFTSGLAQGRIFPISALTNATTATVVLPPSVTNLGTSVNAGDSFEIVPVNTLKNVFGSTAATVKLQQSAVKGSADLVYLWHDTIWIAYWFDGTRWISQYEGFADIGNTPILSDEGIWVARRSTGAIEYTVSGTVPIPPSLSLEVLGASGLTRKFTFVSNPFPADMTLAGLNFSTLPNWLTSLTQSTADIVYRWNGTAWIAFWHNGTQWINQEDEVGSSNNTPVPAGSGVWVARRSPAPAGETDFASIVRPYSL